MKKTIIAALAISSAIAPATQAATIQYAPSGNSFQPVASNQPANGNVWTGVAQSFTAVDSVVSFGFYLYGSAPSTVLYSLYAGDGLFGVALKQVSVAGPATGSSFSLVSADFLTFRLL